ncbi:MAG: hypothetical protein HY901_25240, partial [Deltaproteobacteria bacterium]|nr:hypothetical protein [Deltaproteobacteria bacterium]
MLHRSAATLAVATFFSCGSAQILTPAPLVDGSVAASACVGSQDCPEGSLCLDGACHAWTSEEEPAADAAVVDAGARDAEATSGPDAESGVDAGSIVTDSVDSGWFPADASLAGAPDSSACQPTTCSSLGAECGTWPNGCGNALSCGACGGSTTCQQGHCVGSSQVDCSGIAGHPGFELCTQTDQSCAGVFTNGAGCSAFCAAAGLRCVARYGGDTGCQKESQVVLTCDEANGHLSDWCECGLDASCQSATCASLGAECGTWPDGCGNDLTCGSCSGSSTCQQGHCVGSSVLDCSAIASHSGFELCTQTDEICAGVFTNGAGCTAYCASAGLRCTARYGGDPGCQKEALTML